VRNYPESVEYLYTLGNELKSAKLGLDLVGLLWQAMGFHGTQPPVVHVAGTNGKGSTCAMIEAALRAAGIRTGLYTSPHLISPTERIQINGRPITPEQFAHTFDIVHRTALRLIADGSIAHHPSYFETVTLMAFEAFVDQNVDRAVIEVGLGGRLDATNVVKPELCVITPVDFDHEDWLGKSIESIAFEKAGILKPGVPAVIAAQRPAALAVIEARAREVNAPLYFSSEVTTAVPCPLAGEHQIENARTAARALQLLGVPLDGMAKAVWPGRLETVSRDPLIILDGAHNPAGAKALARYMEQHFAGQRVGMIFGAMRDKAFEEISSILFPLVDELICTAPAQARALRPEAMLELAPHPNARAAANLGEALALPRNCDVLVITGSLYLVGEARALLVE
jgi:dihydrofolate synthase / folylpolyglutamate synthase